ncbi:NAD(P)/FAD-dependent oxidoreductase [Streptomyces sp. M2CJ-2]|uniref:NAD(P)/FAD-dependent oxidoreductase n=1 Tax=Streptomyces sp. M2CJ-2 TaxID=2803948 RepID=UPI0019269708|nr:NAD(P)/FAD-dependent oxidoreductase [Streptomyces sp. M2CJ-2]MBL3668966.1 NAD(P)/FAD-dependent oxidoreductase [Streptomyces sp. M2CJ-2]
MDRPPRELHETAVRNCTSLETGLPGVFAAGDVRRGSAKRVASAVGEGAMAVHHVHEHLGHTAVGSAIEV